MEGRAHHPNSRNRASSIASNPHVLTSRSLSINDSGILRGGGNGMFRGVKKIKGDALSVCVVGAGIAGLRCADVLMGLGVKVTVFEGRERAGGRVHQSNHLGHTVDLGPNWIHGTENNPIMNLAAETRSTLHSWGERQAIFNENGEMLEETEANRYSEIVWGMIADAFRYSNENCASIPPDRSLMDYFEERVIDYFREDGNGLQVDENVGKKKELNYDQKTLLRIAQMWGAFVGDPIERQSLKFFWMEECIEGENPFIASTYKAILARIAEPALRYGVIQFSTKVVRIESRKDDVLIHTENGAPKTFDEVVVTAPLGWLKHNQSAFVPPLPPRLSRAIDSLGYGHLEKVYITFPAAFWETPEDFHSLSKQTTLDESIQSLTTSTTTPNLSPLRSSYPGFTHWLHPLYDHQNPHNWAVEALSLSSLTPPHAHPTLLFYIHGPCSLHLSSLLTSSPPSTHTGLLTDFFKPYYSLLPNYSSTSADCIPARALATSWSSDELAGYGSYTNFQIGLEEGDRDVEVLRDGEGMDERRVWFAGEHTAPFLALGTVTGAYWSGEAVAKRIGEAYEIGSGRPSEDC